FCSAADMSGSLACACSASSHRRRILSDWRDDSTRHDSTIGVDCVRTLWGFGLRLVEPREEVVSEEVASPDAPPSQPRRDRRGSPPLGLFFLATPGRPLLCRRTWRQRANR